LCRKCPQERQAADEALTPEERTETEARAALGAQRGFELHGRQHPVVDEQHPELERRDRHGTPRRDRPPCCFERPVRRLLDAALRAIPRVIEHESGTPAPGEQIRTPHAAFTPPASRHCVPR
jgi:hypothetical protein